MVDRAIMTSIYSLQSNCNFVERNYCTELIVCNFPDYDKLITMQVSTHVCKSTAFLACMRPP